MMVAWHEVPGKAAVGNRPGGYGVMGYAADLRFGDGDCVNPKKIRAQERYHPTDTQSHRTLRDGIAVE